ncbi:MAG TPA: maleylpyruvate isomerase N-terminal domain-containing protein [Dehalococcoidia bacterium]|nr:maleylpyruvate isomerase N-terminal domain-containing protein [Dehalococcoidia bacterium]
MTTDDTDLQHNAESTRRLRELVAKLSDEDLRISLGGGWTVAVALAHLGFWDTRQAAALHHYTETGELLGGASDDAVNAALERLAVLADPRPVAQLAVSAATAVDEVAANLAPDARAAILNSDDSYMVGRWGHREEHLDQIERALPS